MKIIKVSPVFIVIWISAIAAPVSNHLALSAQAKVSSSFQRSRPFDRFGDVPVSEERKRLDGFASELGRDPNATGYIVVYGKREEAKKRADRAKAYLTYSRRVTNRIVSMDHCVRPLLEFELYIVPAGQTFPDPCPNNTRARTFRKLVSGLPSPQTASLNLQAL